MRYFGVSISNYFGLWKIDKQRIKAHIKQFRHSLLKNSDWRKKRILEVWATKNLMKDNYRKGQYSLACFWENYKKVKIEVTGPKKLNFWKVYR